MSERTIEIPTLETEYDLVNEVAGDLRFTQEALSHFVFFAIGILEDLDGHRAFEVFLDALDK